MSKKGSNGFLSVVGIMHEVIKQLVHIIHDVSRGNEDDLRLLENDVILQDEVGHAFAKAMQRRDNNFFVRIDPSRPIIGEAKERGMIVNTKVSSELDIVSNWKREDEARGVRIGLFHYNGTEPRDVLPHDTRFATGEELLTLWLQDYESLIPLWSMNVVSALIKIDGSFPCDLGDGYFSINHNVETSTSTLLFDKPDKEGLHWDCYVAVIVEE